MKDVYNNLNTDEAKRHTLLYVLYMGFRAGVTLE